MNTIWNGVSGSGSLSPNVLSLISFFDTDSDGIPNGSDPDVDGDGFGNTSDFDEDADTIPSSVNGVIIDAVPRGS